MSIGVSDELTGRERDQEAPSLVIHIWCDAASLPSVHLLLGLVSFKAIIQPVLEDDSSAVRAFHIPFGRTGPTSYEVGEGPVL